MEVDPRRKLVFMTRDLTSHTSADPGVYIIDAKDPREAVADQVPDAARGPHLELRRRLRLPLDRRACWRGARSSPPTSPTRRCRSPGRCRSTSARFDQPAGTSHDVTVDAQGVAWVSGQGYIRGYWTEGSHIDPITGQTLTATPTMPVPLRRRQGALAGRRRRDHRPRAFHAQRRAAGGRRPATARCSMPPRRTSSTAAPNAGAVRDLLAGGRARQRRDRDAEDGRRLGPQGPAGRGRRRRARRTGSRCATGSSPRASTPRARASSTSRDPKTPVQVAYFRPDDGVAWAALLPRRLRLRRRQRPRGRHPAPAARRARRARCTTAARRRAPARRAGRELRDRGQRSAPGGDAARATPAAAAPRRTRVAGRAGARRRRALPLPFRAPRLRPRALLRRARLAPRARRGDSGA